MSKPLDPVPWRIDLDDGYYWRSVSPDKDEYWFNPRPEYEQDENKY